MKRLLTLVSSTVIVATLASPNAALACAACFGKSDSNMAKRVNAGIFSLLGVIVNPGHARHTANQDQMELEVFFPVRRSSAFTYMVCFPLHFAREKHANRRLWAGRTCGSFDYICSWVDGGAVCRLDWLFYLCAVSVSQEP